jgi:uncharacterized small protein (DUF1192 family)
MDEEDSAKRSRHHEVGMVLDALSVDELEWRISLLEGEIVRLRQAIASRQSTRAAAEAVFKF